MPRTIALGLLLVFGFAQIAAAQSGAASSTNGPLTFGNNFFVTGDYVVAGAYNMNVNIANGFATGTINVPDKNPATGKPNPGITGATSVPAGAQIVAALLYWQTVEKNTVLPGQAGSGQNGFFRPVFTGGPLTGYPISGWTDSQTTVSFSNGGCTGGSTGKNVRTYRADVRGLLPRDANGNVVVNGTVNGVTYGQYEVKLPSSSSTTPITLGATLVIIYRILSPDVPLNAIVIYDGGYAPGGTLLTMTQTVQGFYDAAESPVSRLTHIVGSGHSNKFETVSLGTNTTPLTALPSLYPNGLPPFPGFYGSWDNPTWTFPDPNLPVPLNYPANPVHDDDASATTMVAPTNSQQGCVSWGAVIFSTTVQNSDNDGLLDVWKTHKGYCDASIHEGSCTVGMPSTGWVDLTEATPGRKDVFVQLDYMCSVLNPDGTCDIRNGNDDTMGFYSFDPTLPLNVDPTNVDPADGKTVVQKVTDAFAGAVSVSNTIHDPITLHVIRTHAIQEATCQDSSGSPLCPYPNQPGVVGWPGGVIFFQNQLVDTAANNLDHDCPTLSPPASCVLRFQRGKKDSYHYVLFGHALGLPNWTLQSGTLTNVVQSANSSTVTFTTSTPHHLFASNSDPSGRVTVAFSTTNAALNGVHLVTSASGGVLRITQTSLAAAGQGPGQGVATYTFTLVSGTAPAIGDFVTVQNTTNGNGIFNVVDATIAAVGVSTFTVNGFPPTPIGMQAETAGRALNSQPPFTFTINIGTSVSTTTSYTEMTDRDLSVASGQAGRVSGFSDVGGAHSVITLGNWDKRLISWQSRSGTFMHELGHSLGLTHGGFYFDNLAHNPQDYTPTVEANCKPNHQSVMNYRFQIDLLETGVDQHGNPVTVVDYSGQRLDSLNKLNMSVNSSNTPFPWITTPAYTNTNWHGTLQEIGNLPASVVTRYCDGRPITGTQFFHVNATTDLLFWDAGQDINLDGTTTTPPLRGHNDWTGTATIPGIDLRQTSATGSLSAAGLLGALGGASGYLPPVGGGGGLLPPLGGGGGYIPPLGGGGGYLPPVGGGGGYIPPLGGGGGYLPPVGGGGGLPESELTQANANSFTRPPTGLMASEAASPRMITLTWTKPFGAIIKYNIYRSDAGGPFNRIGSLSGNPPATTFQDNPACNPGGYRYYVKAVIISDTTHSEQESGPSNTVRTGSDGLLTGCYVVSNFSSPASGVQGTGNVPITWTLTDDFNAAGAAVTRQAANTLVAIGPGLLSNNCTTGRTTLLADGMPTASGVDAFTNIANQFTFTWNNTDAFCAGSYTFELDLDHVPASPAPVPAQVQTTTSALQLSIDVNDTDITVTTLALTAGTVGLAYSNTLTQHGGTAPFTWTFNGSLPTGISQAQHSPTLSGTTCAAGTYNFTAMVTDFKSNSGTQPLTLQINKANTTTGVISNANPSVFQQMVTFTVTVAPQYSCTPTGTVTLFDGVSAIANSALSGGTATFQVSNLSVGVHSITASYGGDNNFSSSSSGLWSQTVKPAPTQIVVSSLSPSPAFVGQPITVSYTFSVVVPGKGSPIVPTGNITVTANVGATVDSSCVVTTPTLGDGMCTLSPAPTTAGPRTFTITYSGDGNFVASGANGNYTVYELVFAVQPSNTVVGHTMTPAVQVAVQDGSNNTLTTFSGGITLAIKSGPGTLSGTIPQNAVNGVATFYDLSNNKVATGDTLVASLTGGVAPAISGAFNITLELNYTQLQPTAAPAARCCVAMAFDPVSNSTLLFGGTVPGLGYAVVNDTWQLTNGQWTQLSPATSPPARSGAAMVYDAAHNNVVLFGGTTGSSDFNDTWIWNGSTWTSVIPATSPPGRRFDSQGMAYDPNMQAVVMFGGIDYTGIFYNDTWVWNGTTWTQMSPASVPSARRTVLATDPSGNVMLFGGGGPSGALADTWVWDGTNWNQQSPATSPAARDLHNMAFNPNVGAVVLFAGGGGFNDVWSWDGTTWTQVTPAAAAAPQRYAFGMDYDGAANAVFVFGGYTNTGPAISDTWEFTVSP